MTRDPHIAKGEGGGGGEFANVEWYIQKEQPSSSWQASLSSSVPGHHYGKHHYHHRCQVLIMADIIIIIGVSIIFCRQRGKSESLLKSCYSSSACHTTNMVDTACSCCTNCVPSFVLTHRVCSWARGAHTAAVLVIWVCFSPGKLMHRVGSWTRCAPFILVCSLLKNG
jgi:hypothetical protein